MFLHIEKKKENTNKKIMADGLAYNSYEAVINGVVGAIYAYVKRHRSGGRDLLMVGIEKAIINLVTSYASVYAGNVDKIDVEYLLSALLAGLYHSRNSFDAAGDQLMVSIISHLISAYSSTAGASWFQRNVFGTTATAPTSGTP